MVVNCECFYLNTDSKPTIQTFNVSLTNFLDRNNADTKTQQGRFSELTSSSSTGHHLCIRELSRRRVHRIEGCSSGRTNNILQHAIDAKLKGCNGSHGSCVKKTSKEEL